MIDNEQVEEILLILDDKLTKTVSVLKEEYASVRAGRANPHILDKLRSIITARYARNSDFQHLRAGGQVPCNFTLGRILVERH